MPATENADLNFSTAKKFKAENETRFYFPWYDSHWLYSYRITEQYLTRYYPEKRDEFVHSCEKFRTSSAFKTIEIQELFSPEQRQRIEKRIDEISRTDYENHELFEFGRFVVHNDPEFTALQKTLVDQVSARVGEEVELSYNFLSLYNNLGVLKPHLDAMSAKWTVDYCVRQSAVWPIHLSKVVPWPEEHFDSKENWVEDLKNDESLHFESFELTPGKALLFSGSSQWHYRDYFKQKSGASFCHLLFFHFVPKGSRLLASPRNWASYFGVPELSELVIDLD